MRRRIDRGGVLLYRDAPAMKNAVNPRSKDVLSRVEAVLSYAQATGSVQALAACRGFLSLYAQPDYELYKPAEFLRSHAKSLFSARDRVHIEPITDEQVGAPGLMLTCLRTLVEAAELEEDTVLCIEVFEEEERQRLAPRIGLGLDGPGRIPDRLLFEGFFGLSLEELGGVWTLATQGGRLDKTANGVLLRLTGMRMPPDALPESSELLARLGWKPTEETLREALAYLDGDEQAEPGDVKAVLRSVLAECHEQLEDAGITVETLIDPDLPPLLMRRKRIACFFENVFAYALQVLPPHSAVVLMAEYDPKAREAGFIITLTTPDGELQATHHSASMRRAIEGHQGSFSLAVASQEATVSATLADSIGKALDAWIPGWDAFSERSRQMLRLLKSGGPTPPEDFILGGVLEEELERWLLGRLASPAAVNIAHKLEADNSGLAGSNAERLKKALGQVTRGKPKKEICQPQYAGELFYAFRHDDRERYTLGTHVLDAEELRRLCEGLLANPPARHACLTLLAAGLTRAS